MKSSPISKYSLAFWLILIITSLISLTTFANKKAEFQPTMPDLLDITERLTYSVHYGFLNLGTVILEEIRDTTYLNQPVYYSRTIIRSNPSIPFVGRKERHFHSFFTHNDTTAYGLNFWTDSIHDNEYLDTRYIFDYDKGFVFIYDFEELTDSLTLDGPADSGPTLHLITRLYAGLDERKNYPIYISNERGDVDMQYTSKVDRINSEAFGGNIDAYYSYGDANVKGPFGFSGAYKAWHKTDKSRIPVEAHVRVWVGNVRVKLQKYEIF